MNQHEYKECYTSRIPVGSRDVRTAVGQIVLRNVQVKIEITPGLCRSKTKLAFLTLAGLTGLQLQKLICWEGKRTP